MVKTPDFTRNYKRSNNQINPTKRTKLEASPDLISKHKKKNSMLVTKKTSR